MNRILVIVYGHVADTMAAIPALRSLRRARPQSRIEVLCLRSVAPLLERSPYVDALIMWDDFKRKRGRAARLEKGAVLGRLAIRLRAGRYDTAIVLHRSFGALRRLAALSGASTVVAAAPIDGVESSRDENRRALSMLGIDDDGAPLEIWTTDADRDSAARLTAEAPGSGPLVGLHPGSDWSCQQWLPERLAAVGSRLQVEVGARLLITGAAGEAALAAEVAEGLRGGAVNAAGRTSLAELVAVIQRLDLLVCVNSAPAAIARAVDTRAVVLLGPEDPRLTGLEEGPGLRVVQPGRRPAPGSWCEFGRWGLLSGCESPMCRGLNGLGELDPGAVVAEAVELLARGPLAPRRTALGA